MSSRRGKVRRDAHPCPHLVANPKSARFLPQCPDSGYETKLSGRQIDYFRVEHPGTVTAAEENAPLASLQPLHLEYSTSLLSLVERATMAPNYFADVALWTPCAATDSSLVLGHSKLVADDSVWNAGDPQPALDAVKSGKSDDSEGSFTCRTSAAIERLTVSQIILQGDIKRADNPPLNRRMSM